MKDVLFDGFGNIRATWVVVIIAVTVVACYAAWRLIP